jgi:hypothetical protein
VTDKAKCEDTELPSKPPWPTPQSHHHQPASTSLDPVLRMPGTMGTDTDANTATAPGLESSASFSMLDLENELVDITASSSPSSSRVKLLFAKSKGMSLAGDNN